MNTRSRHAPNRRLWATLGSLVMLAALGACRTLPDVSPYVDATVQLRGAVGAAGDTTTAAIRRTESPNADALARRLEAEWDERVRAMDAAVRYAHAIQGITQAGRSGEQAAREVAGAMTRFAETVGVVPAAPAVGVATDIGAFVYGQIAMIRASRSLEEALDNAQPVVARLAQLIPGDLADLRTIIVEAAVAERRGMATTADSAQDVENLLRLRQRRTALQSTIIDGLPDADRGPEVADALTKVEIVADQLETLQDIADQYDQRVTVIDERQRAALLLLDEINAAAGEWARAHARLAEAVASRTTPSVEDLLQTASEIRDLVRKVRGL